MKKKITVIMTVLAMLVMMLPITAFAAGEVTLEKGGTSQSFDSVAEAVAAVTDGEAATIKLNQNYTGPGIIVGRAYATQNITIDLGNHVWEITNTVGSVNTETNGMQLLKGNTVYIKNGEITSRTAKFLIQNYCNLTLDNVKLSGQDGQTQLIVSNNNGQTIIKGGTEITAPAGGMAFDSDKWDSYDGGDVILENGIVNGDVNATNGGKITIAGGTVKGDILSSNYGSDGFAEQSPIITITGGTVTGNIQATQNGKITVTGGTFSNDSVKGYIDSASVAASITSPDGTTTNYYVGESLIKDSAANIESGSTIDVLNGTITLDLSDGDGVTVKNSGGGEVKVLVDEGTEILVDDNKEVTVAFADVFLAAVVDGQQIQMDGSDAIYIGHVLKGTELSAEEVAELEEIAKTELQEILNTYDFKGFFWDKAGTKKLQAGDKIEGDSTIYMVVSKKQTGNSDDSQKPQETGKPAPSGNNKTQTSAAKTGDEAMPAMYLFMAFASVLALAGVAFAKRRVR